MDEIKQMLVGIQNSQEELKQGLEKLNDKIDVVEEKLHKEIQSVEESLHKEIQSVEESLHKEIQSVDKKLHKEIREVNSRLAAFQIEMSQKVQTLFDADLTRRENMEDYDERLQNISSELFNHSVRINDLEQKVVGS